MRMQVGYSIARFAYGKTLWWQQRTKSIRLLHKQIVKIALLAGRVLPTISSASVSRVTMKNPLAVCFDRYSGTDEPDRSKYTTPTDGRNWYSIEVGSVTPRRSGWILTRRGLCNIVAGAMKRMSSTSAAATRCHRTVHRSLEQPGDTVLTPFLGIGSGFIALYRWDARASAAN